MAGGCPEGGGRESVGDGGRGKNACQSSQRQPGHKKQIQMPSGGERARVAFFFLVTAGAGAMSKELSRSLALNDISAWDTEEVLQLLRKVSAMKKQLLRRRRRQ